MQTLQKLLQRTRHIRSITFNLNALSEHQQLKNFRFLTPHIQTLTTMLSWSGETKRSSHSFSAIIATCIFLFRLATKARWYEAEMKFGLQTPVLSEILW